MQEYRFNLRRHLTTMGGSAFFGFVSLAVLQLVVLWGVWDSWDLYLWDGAAYFASGHLVATSFTFPPFELSPLFAGYYSIFHILFAHLGPFAIFFAHRVVAICLTNGLFYVLLRKMFPPPVAWLFAAYTVILVTTVGNYFVVHIFVLVPLLLSFIAAFSKSVYRNGWILLFLLATCLIRPEYIIALGMALVWLIYRDYKANKDRVLSTWLRVYSPFLVGLVITFVVLGKTTPTTNRAWVAFGQHYALGYQERNPNWEQNAFLHFEEATEQMFGDTDSLIEAALNNPQEMAEHFLWNGLLFPRQLLMTLLTFLPPVWNLSVIIFVITMTLIMGWALWRSRSKLIDFPLIKQREFWIVLGCTLIPLLGSAIVIRPRVWYLSPLIILFFLIMGLGMEVCFERRRLEQLQGALPIVFVLFLVFFPQPFNVQSERSIIPTVESIAEFRSDDRFGILADCALAFCIYPGFENCQPFSVYKVPDDQLFDLFLTQNNIQIIMINGMLTDNLPPQAQTAITHLDGWELFDRVGGYDIYMRIP